MLDKGTNDNTGREGPVLQDGQELKPLGRCRQATISPSKAI